MKTKDIVSGMVLFTRVNKGWRSVRVWCVRPGVLDCYDSEGKFFSRTGRRLRLTVPRPMGPIPLAPHNRRVFNPLHCSTVEGFGYID